MIKTRSIILMLTLLFSYTTAARILGIFPITSKSHFICNNAVMKSLTEAGHEITVITPFPKDAAKENFTSVIDSSQDEFIHVGQNGPEYFAKMTTLELFKFFRDMGLPQCEKILKLKEIQAALNSKEKQYDVIFTELFCLHRCFYWIGKKLNIPVIGVITLRSWILVDWEISNTRHPILIPNENGQSAKYETFYDRIYHTWKTIEYLYHGTSHFGDANAEFYRNNIRDEITFEEFMNLTPSLVFINAHSSYFPRPQNPNIIEIGGIHIPKIKSLSNEIQTFLDEAKHGAILFSFGSIVRAAKVPREKIQAFKEVFSDIPQRVIWKYEEDLENVSSNVMLLKWLPQNDILAHKNVIAFISHCGQGAIHEAIYHGVPLISCPLFGDQFVNAGIFENQKIAVHLDYDTITKDSVLQSLNEIVNNTRYYENMKKKSKAFKDRPMTPQQSVVYWTEYVVRNDGAPHLTTPASQLNLFQYFLLDIICLIAVIVIFALYFSLRIITLTHSLILFCLAKPIKNKTD